MIKLIFEGHTGPARDIVLLNAGADGVWFTGDDVISSQSDFATNF